MEKNNYPPVLAIGGSDSSGGAGIQADIKTISALGGYGASVITALTAQNTLGVQSIEMVNIDFVRQQLESVFSDIYFQAIKIGMLHTIENVRVVTAAIAIFKPKNIVIDPVMISKNGTWLIDVNTISEMQKQLFMSAELITPNIVEAENLLEASITDFNDMEDAAIALGLKFNTNVLVKGGHLNSLEAADVLYHYADKKLHWYKATRIQTNHTHGTGCTYSSAIATYLAKGVALTHALSLAKKYISAAIVAGEKYSLGRGIGPVDHFYFQRKNNDI